MVHEVASRGFDQEAETYERSRPSYPADAVAWLVGQLRIGRDTAVVDLAAGTGKLTRLLQPTGARIVAVEPVPGMRRLLRRLLPAVPVVAATAEAMPLRASSADAVCVAQAFHWFDADRAFAELHRVLRPGGRVGLLWNVRDRSVDWVDRVWTVMDGVERRAPWRDHEHWSPAALGDRSGFGALVPATFRSRREGGPGQPSGHAGSRRAHHPLSGRLLPDRAAVGAPHMFVSSAGISGTVAAPPCPPAARAPHPRV